MVRVDNEEDSEKNSHPAWNKTVKFAAMVERTLLDRGGVVCDLLDDPGKSKKVIGKKKDQPSGKQGMGRDQEKVRWCGQGLPESVRAARRTGQAKCECSAYHKETVMEPDTSRNMSKRCKRARTDAVPRSWIWTRGYSSVRQKR